MTKTNRQTRHKTDRQDRNQQTGKTDRPDIQETDNQQTDRHEDHT